LDNNFDVKITDSLFFHLFKSFFIYYKSFLLRKAISSRNDFLEIRSLYSNLYMQLDKKVLLHIAYNEKGLKRLKAFAVFVVYYNYLFFRSLMFFYLLFFRIKERVKTLK